MQLDAKSQVQTDLDSGKVKVGAEERRLAKAARKTPESLQLQADTEENRKK